MCSLALAFQNCINIFSTGVLTLKDHTPANAEATTASTMKRQIDVDRITSLKTSLRSAKRTQLGVLLTGLVETSKRRNRCSVSPAIAIRAFQKFENGTEPTCVDVDECQKSNGGCQHACQNLVHKIVSDIKEL